MTDSTIENKPGDGGFDVGSSADELFGEIADEPLETDGDRTSEVEPDEDDGAGVEDQTAATVFGQLKDEVEAESSETDDLLADESPEDIIASADDPDPEPAVDEDLLVDEEELTDLLLTERTKGEEFLWVDADEDETSDLLSAETDPADDAEPDEVEFSERDLEETDEPDIDSSSDTDPVESDELDVDTADASSSAIEDASSSPTEDASSSPTEDAADGSEGDGSPAPSNDRPQGLFARLRATLAGFF
ncbi:hypothetical protein [Natrarchaeobius chitinivorans]|uniref:Uncharacterized protein n=1 Tax=Natrarchaeobius chitinivorans TaxID=1679083 RepID=A0A3N6MSM5_NATCH|nr:hypothetical protein [Natrarchaeobius chitinivorans]RQG97756.1 hypothetical protein EA473_00635 [Natrarchaeobius chitinivorans]